MTLDFRKYRLIRFIMGLTDDLIVSKFEALLEAPERDEQVLKSLQRPITDSLNLETLIKEQHFSLASQEDLDQIIKDAAIEEPIEDLIRML
ncbi:MAG: hypothetical protein AAF696_27235 [Bacteroidota bacterium]